MLLVLVSEKESFDSQPFGGTDVSDAAKIGPIQISKIKKKGRENRRFRIRFGALTENSA
jgi:misacylated tRNA(Ala) deacylase